MINLSFRRNDQLDYVRQHPKQPSAVLKSTFNCSTFSRLRRNKDRFKMLAFVFNSVLIKFYFHLKHWLEYIQPCLNQQLYIYFSSSGQYLTDLVITWKTKRTKSAKNWYQYWFWAVLKFNFPLKKVAWILAPCPIQLISTFWSLCQ